MMNTSRPYKYRVPHRIPLVLLVNEKGCHAHPSSDTHRSNKDLLVCVLSDAKAGRDLTSAG